MSGLPLIRELVLYLKEEKKWWLIPLCLLLLILGLLIIFIHTSALAPFVYPVM